MSDTLPRPEHPRPDRCRENWLNLNGRWEFETDRANSGSARGLATGKKLDEEILVPFAPESRLSGIADTDFHNCVWYRRRLNVPEKWAGQRVLLHFGAVDYLATVWLNGQELGRHEGGYTPFSVELTGKLKGNDELVVRAVDDCRTPGQPRGKQCPEYLSHGCVYTRTTGIWQTVWLEAVPKTYVRDLRLVPDLDNSRLAVSLGIDGCGTFSGRVRALADGNEVATSDFAGNGTSVSQLALRIPEPRPWSPGDPFLYDLEVTLDSAGARDVLRSYFGLRKVHTEGNRILLNNEPIFLRLILDQGFCPEGIYTAPSDEDLRQDHEWSMKFGFNGARLHQKVFEPRSLYWADRLGYLLWGEYADWGYQFQKPEFGQRMVRQWLEVLRRDSNHPSIIGWCPMNETMRAGSEQYGEWLHRTLYEINKLHDPGRLAIDTSGYFHWVTDVWDCHNYDQDVGKFAAAFEPLRQGRWQDAFTNTPNQLRYDGTTPYFVSEYGGIWWNPGQADDKAWGYGQRPRSEEEFLARFRGMTEVLLRNPNIAAFCYTQLTDVEQEVNGLLTYDRKPKFDPALLAPIVSQRAAIEGR
jgi:beta-galactosidase/beta-glucuronidase